jgi:hypothetical protein
MWGPIAPRITPPWHSLYVNSVEPSQLEYGLLEAIDDLKRVSSPVEVLPKRGQIVRKLTWETSWRLVRFSVGVEPSFAETPI